jgi:hypothetical protein
MYARWVPPLAETRAEIWLAAVPGASLTRRLVVAVVPAGAATVVVVVALGAVDVVVDTGREVDVLTGVVVATGVVVVVVVGFWDFGSPGPGVELPGGAASAAGAPAIDARRATVTSRAAARRAGTRRAERFRVEGVSALVERLPYRRE